MGNEFKPGNIVFIPDSHLKDINIPLSEGNIHTLSKYSHNSRRFGRVWVLCSGYSAAESYFLYTTPLLKALL
jgi:hypothetical protein